MKLKDWSMLIVAVVVTLVIVWGVKTVNDARPAAEVDRSTKAAIKASGECLQCHARTTPAITKQYLESRHAKAAVNCLDCHKALNDKHSFEHNGFKITKEVTAGSCARCHSKEYEEFNRSRHALPSWTAVAGTDSFTVEQLAQAAKYHPGKPVERGPNKLAQLEGMGAIENGCGTCHEIGKPNYDGSIGDCSKCHGRHEFSVAFARTPETCGSCHMGPDHSQLEIWRESKHGVGFEVRRDKQDLTVRPKDLTTEHQDMPTCSTCHMSGLGGTGMSHDVGERLSYYLFAPVSTKRPHAAVGEDRMKKVCSQCHASSHVDEFYRKAELTIPTTNKKVAESMAIMKELRDLKLLTPEPFDEPIEFEAFNLWHHWGRTVKHGAYMGGADYTQWHGNYEMLHSIAEMKKQAEELKKHGKKKG